MKRINAPRIKYPEGWRVLGSQGFPLAQRRESATDRGRKGIPMRVSGQRDEPKWFSAFLCEDHEPRPH